MPVSLINSRRPICQSLISTLVLLLAANAPGGLAIAAVTGVSPCLQKELPDYL